MDRRDQQLLDKQLSHISSEPAPVGSIVTAIVLFFFIGMTLGGALSSGGDRNGRSAAVRISQSNFMPR